MTKVGHYYFTDSIFQLELNLHNIRRELILMIEEFEKEDCFVCLHLKCRCVLKSAQHDNSFDRSQCDSVDNSKEGTPNKAPPADSLPKPKFKKEELENLTTKEGKQDIVAWIESSKTAQAKIERRLPTDILLALKKSWAEARNDVKKERILDDFKKERVVFDARYAAANAVEMFFNSFKVQPVVTAENMTYVTHMASIYGNHKSRPTEYSYF